MWRRDPSWTLTQENACLTWIPHIKALPCPPGVLKSSSRNYCFSLAPWNGLYMPGWFESPLGFRLITENQQSQRCPDGYQLISAVRCIFAWQHYTVGDAVPPSAVQGNMWKHGTPLYCVKFQYRINACYIGYYLHTIQNVYIMGLLPDT